MLVVVDVSNPTTPVQVGVVTGFSSPPGIAVQGRYAYVVNYGTTTLHIVDISNPAAPITVATTSGFIGPSRVVVSGRYAYVSNFDTNKVSVVDVSSSTAPVVITHAITVGTAPLGFALAGRLLAVMNYTSQTFFSSISAASKRTASWLTCRTDPSKSSQAGSGPDFSIGGDSRLESEASTHKAL